MAILLQGGRVFDGTGSDPFVADVLMRDGVIEAVEERIAAPEGAEVIDARGKFVMPGMIDCHVHATLFGDEGLATYARMGVTTVKDLGGALADAVSLRDRRRAGEIAGARVCIAGTFIEGDPPAWGGAIPAELSGMEVHRTANDVDRTIERNLAVGVDGIKLYAALPPDLVRRAIERVAKRVPVTGHLTATTAGEAVAAGIDGLEHLQLTFYRDLVPAEHALGEGDVMSNMGYWGKVRRGWEAIEPSGEPARRLIDVLAERETRVIPTLVLGGRTNVELTSEEEAALTSGQRARLAVRPSGSRPSPADLERSATNMLGVTAAMHRAGVQVLPGTDCGAVGVPPGYGYHIELALMAQAMPNRDVLLAATSGAASWLRRDDLGTIAAGKRADVVVLDADPLADIMNTRRINAVFLDGAKVP